MLFEPIGMLVIMNSNTSIHLLCTGCLLRVEGYCHGKELYQWKNFPGKEVIVEGNCVWRYVFLETLLCRYNKDLEIEDAVHTAILTLKVDCIHPQLVWLLVVGTSHLQ